MGQNTVIRNLHFDPLVLYVGQLEGLFLRLSGWHRRRRSRPDWVSAYRSQFPDPKNVTSQTWGPNWPPLVQKTLGYKHEAQTNLVGVKNVTLRTQSPNWPPLMQKALRYEHRAPVDLPFCKKHYGKNTSPNWPPLVQKMLKEIGKCMHLLITDLMWCDPWIWSPKIRWHPTITGKLPLSQVSPQVLKRYSKLSGLDLRPFLP